jgi:SAM-dependent methyltransferase
MKPSTEHQSAPMNDNQSPAYNSKITLDSLLRGTPNAESALITTLAGKNQNQLIASYESSFNDAINQGESIYGSIESMPAITRAAHERRMEILDGSPIENVSEKVCIDYGVGSWGFACIYPRLQACRFAIGIDISSAAIKESAAISAKGDFPYKDNYTYLTSRGDDLRIKDQSVDIFFTGECIEHVENTHAFVNEIHRVLRPDGLLILTTPNSSAYLYSIQNKYYGIGPEHVALMSYSELLDYLKPGFNLQSAIGFNGSFHHTIDDKIIDREFANIWARQFDDRPDLATGIVMMLTRRNDYSSTRYQQQYYPSDSAEVRYGGDWRTVNLHREMYGKASLQGTASSLQLSFEGEGLILNFWCHAWSGKAIVSVDDDIRLVNLYSSQGGFIRIIFENLRCGQHMLRVRGANETDPRSQANEVIFYQAISYHCG